MAQPLRFHNPTSSVACLKLLVFLMFLLICINVSVSALTTDGHHFLFSQLLFFFSVPCSVCRVLQTKAPYVPYPSIHAPWYGYLFWVYSTAGGYNKNSDTQFVSAWVEKSSPTANKRVASVQTAKQTNPQTAKQTNSQTQQTQQKTTATNQKPAGKPQTAAPAKTQQNAKAPAKPAAAPAGNKGQPPKQDKKGRRLLAVQQNGGCDANIKVRYHSTTA